MFTGIVTDVGEVLDLRQEGDLRVRIGTSYDVARIDIGASIACEGVCLTVVDLGAGTGQTGAGQTGTGQTGTGPRGWFEVQVSGETVSKTNLSGWKVGSPINLERALRVGDELGGHIVSGHVDGVADVVGLRAEGDSLRVTFRVPDALAKFVAPKGSIALNGTSLTVNEVEGATFGINFIPHTRSVTTWGRVAVGDRVNLEVDTMARYVARLREWG